MEIKDRESHRVVTTAIIYKPGTSKSGMENKFLITKRSLDKGTWGDKWTVPGGGLEVDDYINTPPTTKNKIWYFALENTLRREVREEVGVEMGNISYLLDLAFIRFDNMPVVVLSFYAPWKSGEVLLNHENTEYAWVAATQAEQYDLIDGILQEIQMVDKILKGESPESVKLK